MSQPRFESESHFPPKKFFPQPLESAGLPPPVHALPSPVPSPASTQPPAGAPVPLPPPSPDAAANLGWAAGIVDGEACLHIARQRYKSNRSDTFRLGLYITQNHLGLLEHLRRVVGVHVPIHQVKLTKQHRRQCYTLNYTGNKAYQVIKLLLPYLVRKTEEALAAMEFWVLGRVGDRRVGRRLDPALVTTREWYYRELMRLK